MDASGTLGFSSTHRSEALSSRDLTGGVVRGILAPKEDPYDEYDD